MCNKLDDLNYEDISGWDKDQIKQFIFYMDLEGYSIKYISKDKLFFHEKVNDIPNFKNAEEAYEWYKDNKK